MTQHNPTISAQAFISKWENTTFGEEQAAQSFFDDLCRLVGHPTPSEMNDLETFSFEKSVPGGRKADVYYAGHFVWEFKGHTNQLEAALQQAIGYARHLKNPPLIVASSFDTIRIETHFQGMELVTHEILIQDLIDPQKLGLLRNVFRQPDALKPVRTVEDVTSATARLFGQIVAHMEGSTADPGELALHFNRIVFCLYAEDAGLLPEGLFTRILFENRERPDLSNQMIANLFAQMAQGGLFGTHAIAHFNGDLFKDAAPFELSSGAMQSLGEAVRANWRSIDPSIFGTLFEQALDASKRAQTGAHYTSASDIDLVVGPVIMSRLKREWCAARQEIINLLNADNKEAARAQLEHFRKRLASVKVLDPACGSGNFLYVALRSLLDLEREVIDFAAVNGWAGLTPTVQPDQMLGLEIDHYAAELARTALWIGYIQWHLANGFEYSRSPILTPLDTIQQIDAILDLSDPVNPQEPEWPEAEFIVGNPPFLGEP